MSNSSDERTSAYGSKAVYSSPEVYETYDQDRFTTYGGLLFDRMEKGMVLSSVPDDREAAILECGTGTGRFAAELAKRGYHLAATDVSEGMLDNARARLETEGLTESVDLRYGDIYNLDYADGNFDFVFCIRVLNQLAAHADKRRAIAEMARVVAPGGLLLIDIINRWSLGSLKLASWHIDPGAVRRILREVGCEPIRMMGGLVFSHSLLELLPRPAAAAVNLLDRAVCRVLPFFATRVYFLARKRQ